MLNGGPLEANDIGNGRGRTRTPSPAISMVEEGVEKLFRDPIGACFPHGGPPFRFGGSLGRKKKAVKTISHSA